MTRTPPKGDGYGNIYTPHAGSMIISVQRESGLANRTLVLTPRQVRLLRLLTSRAGLGIVAIVLLSWAYFAMQAVRVPVLQRRIAHMEENSARLDTLQQALGQLQSRYEQVQRMLGAAPASPGAAPTASGATPPGAPAASPPPAGSAAGQSGTRVPASVPPAPVRRAQAPVRPAPAAADTTATQPIVPTVPDR